MKKRALGRTGLKTSLIGFGGFHLVETPMSEADHLLNAYLDAGGNYIETAADYGTGLSERKIGRAVSSRRREFILASKCSRRIFKEAEQSINQSLENLRTDHLDILFIHAVQSVDEADTVTAPGGAMEAVQKAKKDGKVRFIGISGHGKPDALLHAIRNHPYDVLLTGFNVLDRFNFPETEDILLKECLERGIGVIGMKALADGYLYRSPGQAIRYALSLPISVLVLGINRGEYLRTDLKIAESFKPMSDAEKETLFKDAEELGTYVCRQCGRCDGIMEVNPSEIFLLEGEFDRQMDDGAVPDPAQYALRERLKHWFMQKDSAVQKYRARTNPVDTEKDYSGLNSKCPYAIDIDRKLKRVHAKLTSDGFIF